MHFTDVLKMRGTLVIHVRQGDHGPIIRTITKRNTITFDASDVVRQLMAQRSSDYTPDALMLGSMRFGTNNAAPSRYDTNLHGEDPLIRKELTEAKKINGLPGELILQATLTTLEGNGNTLCEAGLFTKGGGSWDANIGGSLKCWARQIHGSIAKTSSISLDYNWTLQFTV